MHFEYLFNNDTQEISQRVSELASSNEPALRAHCQEVSRQTDTSSLAVKEECLSKASDANAILEAMKNISNTLSRSVSQTTGVFGVQNGKEIFPTVCRAIVQIEEERQRLLIAVANLTHLRHKIASCVAETNQVLHFLSLAKGAVPEELRSDYAEAIGRAQTAYERLKNADSALGEAQNFYMTFIEKHLPAFMERLRAAADFNHAGAELDGAQICALCKELLILQNRIPNVVF